jgi:hypothetical protein
MEPIELAQQVLRVVGDADADTAHTALEIARLLLNHRERAAIDFASGSAPVSEDGRLGS